MRSAAKALAHGAALRSSPAAESLEPGLPSRRGTRPHAVPAPRARAAYAPPGSVSESLYQQDGPAAPQGSRTPPAASAGRGQRGTPPPLPRSPPSPSLRPAAAPVTSSRPAAARRLPAGLRGRQAAAGRGSAVQPPPGKWRPEPARRSRAPARAAGGTGRRRGARPPCRRWDLRAGSEPAPLRLELAGAGSPHGGSLSRSEISHFTRFVFPTESTQGISGGLDELPLYLVMGDLRGVNTRPCLQTRYRRR